MCTSRYVESWSMLWSVCWSPVEIRGIVTLCDIGFPFRETTICLSFDFDRVSGMVFCSLGIQWIYNLKLRERWRSHKCIIILFHGIEKPRFPFISHAKAWLLVSIRSVRFWSFEMSYLDMKTSKLMAHANNSACVECERMKFLKMLREFFEGLDEAVFITIWNNDAFPAWALYIWWKWV